VFTDHDDAALAGRDRVDDRVARTIWPDRRSSASDFVDLTAVATIVGVIACAPRVEVDWLRKSIEHGSGQNRARSRCEARLTAHAVRAGDPGDSFG
jgi:hypothetical protein